ncbi:TraR/DksA family transcriptional regulator, partial [Pseudomonas aeruginosa]|nr:TraR/DksA family transcriptional regulator [Pseudomonas aeruginosa]
GMRQVGLARLRLAEGRYGQCERCGEAIEPARLAALPAAEYCLRCADLVHR